MCVNVAVLRAAENGIQVVLAQFENKNQTFEENQVYFIEFRVLYNIDSVLSSRYYDYKYTKL